MQTPQLSWQARCKGHHVMVCFFWKYFFKMFLQRLSRAGLRSRAFGRLVYTAKTFSSSFRKDELDSLSDYRNGRSIKVYLPSTDHVGSRPVLPRRLLVVMVGWAQSRHSVLSKYASIYTQLGVPCVAIATGAPLIWFTSLGNSVTLNILGFLDRSLELPVSLLLHIFSGGGTVLFPQLLLECAKPDSPFPSKLCPAGVVFDSGPSEFSRRTGLAASKLVYKQGGFNAFTYPLATTTGILVDLAIGSRKRSEEEAALAHPQLLQVPQLYLYSEKDSVNPPDRARKVMEGQRARGREVTSKCWSDTEHVRHFSQHQEEYTKAVVDFMVSLHKKHNNK